MRFVLADCRARLARRVLDRVGPAGLVSAPCTSRVLESALLLSLLTKEDLAHAEADLVRRYLKTALDTDPPDPLQCAFARAALGEHVAGRREVVTALDAFDHFSSGRKLIAFQTLMAELGAAEFPRNVPAAAFDPAGQPTWLRLQQAALKVMIAPADATDQDWEALAPAVRPGPVWEHVHLARLLGLLALRKNPAHRPAVRETLLRVAAEQLPGGGVPFVSGLDVFATGLAGLALAHQDSGDPRLVAMADAVAAHQNPDGGFGFTAGVSQSDVDDTSYCLEFLRREGRHPETVVAAERYLLAQQNTDGGFPTFHRGSPSEVAMTAGAVNALAPNPAHRAAVERGVAHIVDSDRVIERSWSRNATNAVFRTTLALSTLTADAPSSLRSAAIAARERGLTHLADTQERDGGWGHEPGDDSDPISTAYAVIALASSPRHSAVLRRAVDHLLERQRPDGGYVSRPDQAGPRPLLYDVPVLADVCVLYALTAVCRASPESSSPA